MAVAPRWHPAPQLTLRQWGMLSPGQPLSPALLAVALVAVLATVVLRALRKDRREYARFTRYRSSIRRQATFRRWLIESFTIFGGASLLVLALAWQYLPLLLADIDAWPVMRWFRTLMAQGGTLAAGIVAGAGAALVAGTVFAVYLARHSDEVPAVGNIAALLPRNRPELAYGLALSVNAGVVEELLFRLALPTLVYAVTGSAVIAVVGSVVLFGLLHVYQGLGGVIASLLIGLLLMAIYLASGSILVAMLVHIAIDLRSLVLIPMVVFGVHRKRGRIISAR